MKNIADRWLLALEDIPSKGLELAYDDIGELVTELEGIEPVGEVSALLRLDRSNGEIRVTGSIKGRVSVACDRCLNRFHQQIDHPFFYLFLPQERASFSPEMTLNTRDMETAFYSGPTIDLGDVLREQVALELPVRLLCRSGCKGLCPGCGRDLNQGPCNCTVAKGPSGPFAALAALKDKEGEE